ncbi:hypothetical protein J1605_019281, partial [Eschrichtius robustus]
CAGAGEAGQIGRHGQPLTLWSWYVISSPSSAMYWKSEQMFVCKLEEKDVPELAVPPEKCQGLMSEECGRTAALAAGRTRKGAGEEGLVSPEGVGDEDSCSSSAPLSPSSSPRSMASGSVCPPGKCVCNSCGLEIVDKYLLKVGRSREAQGQRGSPGALGEVKSLFSLSFPLKFSLENVDFLSTTAQSGATHAVWFQNCRARHKKHVSPNHSSSAPVTAVPPSRLSPPMLEEMAYSAYVPQDGTMLTALHSYMDALYFEACICEFATEIYFANEIKELKLARFDFALLKYNQIFREEMDLNSKQKAFQASRGVTFCDLGWKEGDCGETKWSEPESAGNSWVLRNILSPHKAGDKVPGSKEGRVELLTLHLAGPPLPGIMSSREPSMTVPQPIPVQISLPFPPFLQRKNDKQGDKDHLRDREWLREKEHDESEALLMDRIERLQLLH